jgi:hypothetical protein
MLTKIWKITGMNLKLYNIQNCWMVLWKKVKMMGLEAVMVSL